MPGANGGTSNFSEALRQQSAIGYARRATSPATPLVEDPVDVAIRDKRKLLAARISDASTAELEIQAQQLANERMKLDIEANELEQQKTGKADNGYQEFLLGMVQQTQSEMRELSAQVGSAQRQLLEEKIGILQGALEKVQQNVEANGRGDGADHDPMQQAIDVLENAKKLVALTSPPTASEAPMMGQVQMAELELRKWEKTVEFEREKERQHMTLEAQRDERKWAMEREQFAREQARLDSDSAAKNKFWQEILPQVVALGKEHLPTLVGSFTGKMPPTQAPVQEAAADQAAPVELHPGFDSQVCPQCGSRIIYDMNAPRVVCSTCGSVYTNDQSPQEPPRQPVGVTSREVPDGFIADSEEE